MLSINICDIPGADIFALEDDGKLSTPAQQQARFLKLVQDNKVPVVAELNKYIHSRGLTRGLNRKFAIEAIITSMKLEALKSAFTIIDPLDGHYEKQRVAGSAGGCWCVDLRQRTRHIVPPPSLPENDVAWKWIHMQR